MNDCKWTCVRAFHMLLRNLSQSLQFNSYFLMCYVSLISNFKATTQANFIHIGFESFEIYYKTKERVFFLNTVYA